MMVDVLFHVTTPMTRLFATVALGQEAETKVSDAHVPLADLTYAIAAEADWVQSSASATRIAAQTQRLERVVRVERSIVV